MESARDWYEFVGDDLETHPGNGAKILAEFEDGTLAQVFILPAVFRLLVQRRQDK